MDPMQVISEALHQWNEHDRAWADCGSCWTNAGVAVAALKAHPDALAALLERGWWDPTERIVQFGDGPVDGMRVTDLVPIYRLPEPS